MTPTIWEKQGVDKVKADLANDRYGPRRRIQVEQWLAAKAAEERATTAPNLLLIGVVIGLAIAILGFLLIR